MEEGSVEHLSVDYLMGTEDGTDSLEVCPNCGFGQRRVDTADIKTQIEQVKHELRQQSQLRRQESATSSAFQEEDIENSDDDDTISVSLNPIEELPIILCPFPEADNKKNYAKWKAPAFLTTEREKQFKWEKPWGVEETTNDTPAQRARRLELVIEEKERDIEALRRCYKKAQRENYTLVQEIRSFKGEHYDELKADNVRLKESHGRVFRENLMLRGQLKKMNNRKIAELEEKEKIDAKYSYNSGKKK